MCKVTDSETVTELAYLSNVLIFHLYNKLILTRTELPPSLVKHRLLRATEDHDTRCQCACSTLGPVILPLRMCTFCNAVYMVTCQVYNIARPGNFLCDAYTKTFSYIILYLWFYQTGLKANSSTHGEADSAMWEIYTPMVNVAIESTLIELRSVGRCFEKGVQKGMLALTSTCCEIWG